SRNASAWSNTSFMNRPASSSKCGTSHPPRVNPRPRSSSGPPGPCITPSTETNVVTVSFIALSPSEWSYGKLDAADTKTRRSTVRSNRPEPHDRHDLNGCVMWLSGLQLDSVSWRFNDRDWARQRVARGDRG